MPRRSSPLPAGRPTATTSPNHNEIDPVAGRARRLLTVFAKPYGRPARADPRQSCPTTWPRRWRTRGGATVVEVGRAKPLLPAFRHRLVAQAHPADPSASPSTMRSRPAKSRCCSRAIWARWHSPISDNQSPLHPASWEQVLARIEDPAAAFLAEAAGRSDPKIRNGCREQVSCDKGVDALWRTKTGEPFPRSRFLSSLL